MLIRSALTLTAVVLFALPAPAAEKKPGTPRDFPFWSAPKRPHASAFVPGLQAALQLSPEQCEKIEAACRETIDKPEAKGKNAAGAAAAIEKVHQLVADVLTPEQKKLIEKLNDAYSRVAADVGEDFQPKYAAAKGNEEETATVRKDQQEALAAAFEKRLDTILTAEQREAVKKAADEQKKREAGNKGKSKPGK
jgi:hypothetical protein